MKEVLMMNNPMTALIYGNQATRTFCDIFPDVNTFILEWENSGIAETALDLDISFSTNEIFMTYYLLYAKYGNSHIASSDENQFKYKLWSIMFQHGPTWIKKLNLQKEIRALNINDIANTKAIYNHSFNPSTEPSTATLEELTTINEQNTSSIKRAKGDAYSLFMSLLDADFSEEYINRFKKLFLKIVEPTIPLWYITEGE